jgi:hypothetical protein
MRSREEKKKSKFPTTTNGKKSQHQEHLRREFHSGIMKHGQVASTGTRGSLNPCSSPGQGKRDGGKQQCPPTKNPSPKETGRQAFITTIRFASLLPLLAPKKATAPHSPTPAFFCIAHQVKLPLH